MRPTDDARRFAPAAERNQGPILEVLRTWLPAEGALLELASGTGQHAVPFARHLPALTFVPTDVEPDNLRSIQAWRDETSLPNLEPPRALDVRGEDWGVGEVQAVFNANLIHISPWECCTGVLRGAARHLAPGGVLVLYGPYRIGGAHTAPSNAAFDESLKSRDPRWGVRDLEAVLEQAEAVGLSFLERVPMPANNQTLVLRR